MMDVEKLRILCLHGYRQNNETFREKSGGLRKLLKKYATFTFVEAPHVPAFGTATDEARGVVCSRVCTWYTCAQVKGWWFSTGDASFSSRTVTDSDVGFAQSVQLVAETIRTLGPFDGILGFSQGASMAHLLLAKSALGEINLPQMRFALLFSGFKSACSKHAYLNAVPLTLPSLHVFGAADTIVLPETSRLFTQCFVDPVILVHDSGHCIPSMRTENKEKICAFLKQQFDS